MPAFNLSPAQRADLRAQAHSLKPVVIIGAEGLTDPVVAEAERAIKFHQLIKIRVFGDDRDARVEMADSLSQQLNAALVQHIGKLLVLWRPSDDGEDMLAVAGKPRARVTGPSANAALARRAAEAPAGKRAVAPARKTAAGTAVRGKTAGLGGRGTAVPVKRASARPTVPLSATASPRDRAKTRDVAGEPGEARPRTGKGAAPRMVTVIKPTGNDRRRARPTEVMVRGNERVTQGGNVKRAKKRPTSVKRLRQAD